MQQIHLQGQLLNEPVQDEILAQEHQVRLDNDWVHAVSKELQQHWHVPGIDYIKLPFSRLYSLVSPNDLNISAQWAVDQYHWGDSYLQNQFSSLYRILRPKLNYRICPWKFHLHLCSPTCTLMAQRKTCEPFKDGGKMINSRLQLKIVFILIHLSVTSLRNGFVHKMSRKSEKKPRWTLKLGVTFSIQCFINMLSFQFDRYTVSAHHTSWNHIKMK